MALASLNTALPWPGFIHAMSTPAIGTDQTLDAAGEYIAYIFGARQAMTISHVAFRSGAVSGSPTADVRIETVGADGLPTGTLWATDSNIVTGTLSATTTALHALTASASITTSQVFCIKIAYNSGTSFIVQQFTGGAGIASLNFPYQVANTGTPTKTRFLNGQKILALGSSTSAFYSLPYIYGATAVTAGNFNNTNSAARGLRFQIPFSCRAVGLRHYQAATVGDFAILLTNDAGTELSSSSTTYEGDQSGASTGGFHDQYFDNTVTLSPGTWYRALIQPNSTTNVNVSTMTLLSADYRSGTPFGVNAHYTTRASGSFDDSNTSLIPFMEIMYDQLDDGASAGGGRPEFRGNNL